MSRRVLCLLLALLLVGSLAGCKQETTQNQAANFGLTMVPEEQEASAEAPVAGPVNTDTFSLPYNAGTGWDPYNCLGMENQAVMDLIYEGLFTMTPDYGYENVLCESFEVSETGYTYTLYLRDAKFSNGRTLTADDVVYSLGLAEESDLYYSRFDDVSDYYAEDSGTVIISMYEANDRLPCLLTMPIIPSGAAPASAPGTGPFARTDTTTLTQNANWWGGTSNLKFKTVNLYSSQSAEDTRDGFEVDKVHLVYNNPSASTAATFHGDYELWNSPSGVMQYIGFNFEEGILQDKAVRKLITGAIDRSIITETVYHNFASAVTLPVSTETNMYFDDLASKYGYTSSGEVREELKKTSSFWLPEDWLTPDEQKEADKAKAEAEAEAQEQAELEGIFVDEEEEAEETEEEKPTAYNRIVMLVQGGNLSREAAAKIVADNLRDAGFSVEMEVREGDYYYYALNNEEWHLYYGEINLKPDFDLREILLQEGDYSYGGIREDKELRELFTGAMENEGNRYDLYEYIMEEGYICPILFVNNAVFTARGVFSGLNPAPDNVFYGITNVEVHHN